MKTGHKDKRPEDAIIYGAYIAAMLMLAVISWVAYDASSFGGGLLFGAAVATAAWFTWRMVRWARHPRTDTQAPHAETLTQRHIRAQDAWRASVTPSEKDAAWHDLRAAEKALRMAEAEEKAQ
jgi:hypothetical protein